MPLRVGIRALQRDHVGLLDADDLPALRAALGQMAGRLAAPPPGSAADETEIEFRGGSLRVALVLARDPRRKPSLVLRLEPDGPSALLEAGELRRFDEQLAQALTRLEVLRRRP